MFYDSGLMPKHFYDAKGYDNLAAKRHAGIAGVCTMVMYGAELGLSPMQAIRMMHVIEGKPVVAAEAKVAIVKRSGKCRYFRVVATSDEACTCETWREGNNEPDRLTVKIWKGDPKQMPKPEDGIAFVAPTKDRDAVVTPAWAKFPSRMLKARCSSWLCSNVYEDVCAGLYSAEEMIDLRYQRTHEQNLESIEAMTDWAATEAAIAVRNAGSPEPETPEPAQQQASEAEKPAEQAAPETPKPAASPLTPEELRLIDDAQKTTVGDPITPQSYLNRPRFLGIIRMASLAPERIEMCVAEAERRCAEARARAGQ